MNLNKIINYINVVKNLVKNPFHIFPYLGGMNLLNWMPDSLYLKTCFQALIGHKLNLKNPKTFNEKLQWLKLYDRNPAYTQMVDKYAVRDYIKNTIGEEYLIPLLGVWDSFEEIDFDTLPNQFVLKTNHDSGTVIICKDKNRFDIGDARKKITRALRKNYYYSGREWPYKNVKPKIIAEKYLVDESGVELKDYKIFAFDGSVKLIQVDFDRFGNHRRNIYTPEWEYISLSILYPSDPSVQIDRPLPLQNLLNLASILSKGIPHVRTDFYVVHDRIYFGELTFYHGSGYEPFNPDSWNEKMGNWIRLPDDSME